MQEICILMKETCKLMKFLEMKCKKEIQALKKLHILDDIEGGTVD